MSAATWIIACPACGHELKLPDESFLGRPGRCPDCRHKFVLDADRATRTIAPVQTEILGTLAAAPAANSSPAADAETATPVAAATNRAPRPAPAVGDEFGRYRLLKLLGQGAMGTVYQAHDTQLHRDVALKIPRFEQDVDPELLERFYREARTAATLRHPNICPVFDVGEVGGTHYISMAFIGGRPLSAFISPDKPFAQKTAALIVIKLAGALGDAHANGVVHRDLKPSNIMIDDRQDPIVMDFGLATQRSVPDARLTQTGTILGTPAYMSPEQARGEVDRIGPASDIYGLGVILYEMLTGDLPFRGSTGAVLGQILASPPVPPRELRPEIDAELEAVCLKAMSKPIEGRFASMAELADSLRSYLLHKPGGKAPAPAAVSEQSTPPPVPSLDVSGAREPAGVTQSGADRDTRQDRGGSGGDALRPRRAGRHRDAGAGAAEVAVDSDPADASGRRTLALVVAGVAAMALLAGVIGLYFSSGTDRANEEVVTADPAPPAVPPRQDGLVKDLEAQRDAAAQPVFVPIADQTINEGDELSFDVQATLPNRTDARISYALQSQTPAGISLDAQTGRVRWQPGEADGPGDYEIVVAAAADGAPPQTATLRVQVRVNEVNQPPLLAPLEAQRVEEESTLSFAATAIDPDFPIGNLAYSLGPGAPAGCQIDPDTGRISWTPPAGTGGQSYQVEVRVTDDDETGPLTSAATVTIAVAAAERVAAFLCGDDAAKQGRFEAALRALLEEGWNNRQSTAGERRNFAAAQAICRDDPRLYYAAGLLAIKHLQYDESLAQLKKGANGAAYPYPPAWKALIRSSLVKKDHAEALGELSAFAAALEQETPYLGSAARSDAAAWIGRVVGYLDGPANTRRLKDALKMHDARILETLQGERQSSYIAGKEESAETFADLSGVRERERQLAEQQRQEQKAELSEQKSEIKSEQSKLEAAAGKNQEKLEQKLAEFDGQLAPLERSYNVLSGQLQAAALAITQLQAQIVNLNNERQTALQNDNQTLANQLQAQINQCGRQLSGLQEQYQAVNGQIAQVRQQAAGILQQRQAIVAQYQEATGKLIEQSTSLSQWQKRLEGEEKKLQSGRKSRPARAAAADRRLNGLDTYVPFDLGDAKTNLLATLAPAPEREEK